MDMLPLCSRCCKFYNEAGSRWYWQFAEAIGGEAGAMDMSWQQFRVKAHRLGRAFSAGNDVLFIHLAELIISWKTNVFSQLSRNPPKIDVLPVIMFFSFLDTVFFLKSDKKRNFTKTLENRLKKIYWLKSCFLETVFPEKLTEKNN